MTDNDRFDDAVEQAWGRFRTRLAGRIVALWGSDGIEIGVHTATGPAPCVRISTSDDNRVCVAVAGGETFIRPVGRAEELAHHVVTVLREGHGVPHPTFLHDDDTVAYGVLRDQVADTLARMMGRPVPTDADGDFVVVVESQVVFVVVDRTASKVQLWAPLLHEITGRANAADQLVELNRHWPHIKIVLVEDRLVATADVVTEPFVPRHLIGLLNTLRVFLCTVDERFAQRFDGVRYSGDTESDVDNEESLFDEPN
ncbi:T3SS (YopN, CesT) and YbjN peptide-binding chaperone 1 [Rhodococcus chondri]|uniref:TY-Chap central domain-containing protein n=1 Tax=Rhodococcus chondri TaxID=3065941 RepID=A0ABU7JNG1_9NOCA|nr:hypothetical protein [Rhodococcus sp. CC-R104]MEE2031577.1 hypothetical protein [Rhodococcus sp. CC-R104]